MFSYYGGKKRLAKYYPEPTQATIIEPFAGSAAYSLLHFEKQVILIDAYKPLIDLWHYLQQASPKDILSLPQVENGQPIPTYLAEPERYLLGFCCNNGSAYPKHVAGRMNFNSWHRDMGRIADDLHKIKHWTIKLGNYDSVRNVQASWFIDPPYSGNGGKYYPKHTINYSELAKWCQNRCGQVIVCEANEANWLPFRQLRKAFGQRHLVREKVWIRNSVP